MMRSISWPLAAVLAVIGAFAPPAEATQRYKWWASHEVKAEIGMTDQQSEEIERIFQAIRPKLRELMHRLEREEEELAVVMHAMVAEEWEVTLQIDKVEAARSALSKTRTLMLYRMHKKLAPAQLDALHALWERGDSNDRPSSSSRP